MSYLPYEPLQQALLPQALQDWLPEGHLAYFIGDTIDSLDLQAFYARYEGGGSRNQPFHPAMMVKVLIYAYATNVFSSSFDSRLSLLNCPCAGSADQGGIRFSARTSRMVPAQAVASS